MKWVTRDRDVPAISEGYIPARERIVARVERLIEELAAPR